MSGLTESRSAWSHGDAEQASLHLLARPQQIRHLLPRLPELQLPLVALELDAPQTQAALFRQQERMGREIRREFRRTYS